MLSSCARLSADAPVFFNAVTVGRAVNRESNCPSRYLIICVFMLSATAQLSGKRGCILYCFSAVNELRNCPRWSDCPVVFLFLMLPACQVTTPMSTEKKGCSQRSSGLRCAGFWNTKLSAITNRKRRYKFSNFNISPHCANLMLAAALLFCLS